MDALVLGVPTRTDAARLSPDYARAVEQGQLYMRLMMLRNEISPIFGRNHVLEVFSDAGCRDLLPDDPWRKRMNYDLAPPRVARLLRPDLVQQRFTAAMVGFRQARSELEAAGKTGEKVAELYRVLETLESRVNRAAKAHTKLGKILEMTAAADYYQGFLFGLYFSAKINQLCDATSQLENQADHPVHGLYAENAAVAERSEVSLDFAEQFQFRPFGAVIPLEGMLEPDQRMHYSGLADRILFRNAVARRLQVQQGRIVIKGVTYEQVELMDQGSGFVASGPSHQELADLLGQPVVQPGGSTLVPDDWIVDEVKLVADYRAGDGQAADGLLSRYDLDISTYKPTRDKQLGQLAHVCRRL